MKTITFSFTIFLLLFSSYAFAQPCTIPNGSFETWEDLTSDFDDTGMLPPGTIQLPENYVGLFRLFFTSFSDLFDALTGEDLITASEEFFGLYQSTDASDGEYSLQMSADEQFPFADAFTSFECGGELPESFCFDLKHVGGGTDTMTIIGIFDEATSFGSDESELLDASGFFVNDSLIISGNTDWTTYNIPITDNMNGVAPDTAVVFLFMTSNADSIAAGVESYYLIDNMKFKSEGVLQLAVSSLSGVHENNYNKLTWTASGYQNISHFLIERSFGDLDHWQSIGEIPIDHQGMNSYSYKDDELINRGTYYYRIKQISLNGNVDLSEVISINVPLIADFNIATYPNPAMDIVNLEFFLNKDADQLKYQLISSDGKQIDIADPLPKSLNAGYHNFHINVSDLPVGVYNLLIESAFNEVRERVIISR